MVAWQSDIKMAPGWTVFMPAVMSQALSLLTVTGFIGGVGDDLLVGGAGDQTLVGGAGDDAVDGGAGYNTYEVSGTPGGFIHQVIDSGEVLLTDLVVGGDDAEEAVMKVKTCFATFKRSAMCRRRTAARLQLS